jgi:hypothetical protein
VVPLLLLLLLVAVHLPIMGREEAQGVGVVDWVGVAMVEVALEVWGEQLIQRLEAQVGDWVAVVVALEVLGERSQRVVLLQAEAQAQAQVRAQARTPNASG